MLKIALLAIQIATCTLAASAQEATGGLEPVAPLGDALAARIDHLPSYGDRFEAAIKLIEAQTRRPDWSWNECNHLLAAATERPGTSFC